MIPKDLKRPQSVSESSPKVKPIKSKNKLKRGANIEIDNKYFEEILHNDNI